MVGIKTSDTDDRILSHLLRRGNDAPKNIAEEIDTAPEYVSERLRKLREEDLVIPLGSGVWSLTVEGVAYIRAVDR